MTINSSLNFAQNFYCSRITVTKSSMLSLVRQAYTTVVIKSM